MRDRISCWSSCKKTYGRQVEILDIREPGAMKQKHESTNQIRDEPDCGSTEDHFSHLNSTRKQTTGHRRLLVDEGCGRMLEGLTDVILRLAYISRVDNHVISPFSKSSQFLGVNQWIHPSSCWLMLKIVVFEISSSR